MDKYDAVTLARDLLLEFGLPGWDVRLNKNKRQLGVCRENIKRIELSEHYVTMNTREMVIDTILHEIAHAIVGVQHGHDEVWKEMCRRIGCTPKSCEKQAEMPEGDWRAECPTCHKAFNRFRKPKAVRGFYCTECGPELGQLHFKNLKLKYQQRVVQEATKSEASKQLMLKIF
ncbi:MAG TPA: SprT-like domain-containing protein [Drouetiella sp.]